MFARHQFIYVSPTFRCQILTVTYICLTHFIVPPFNLRLLWLLLTSYSSLLLRFFVSSVRPHGISYQSFLVYLPDLHLWVTIAFWTSLLLASSSTINALLSDFYPSGYDFAIPSSLLHLTM